MALFLPELVADSLDSELALKRIKNDLQTDFIYAPHLSAVFLLAGEELSNNLKGKLKNSDFEAHLPLTIEVPKASGLTRPGSILLPYERLAYQLVVDAVAPRVETYIDREHVFSSKLMIDDPEGFMFEPSGNSYEAYKNAINSTIDNTQPQFVLQTDIVSHFQNVNQHNLINLLTASDAQSNLVQFLQGFLLMLTEKNSRGIVQGLMPSDFLGNFSLCSIDSNLSLHGYNFLRYVDDFCIFLPSEHEARVAKMKLSQWLRKEGLDLNEAKTKTQSINDFLKEETEVERLFSHAKEEVEESMVRSDFYHSTISWDFDIEEAHEREINITIQAVHELFDYEVPASRTRDKIDKFCLSTFIATNDSYGIGRTLRSFLNRPHLAQLYAKYIQKMLSENLLDPVLVEDALLNDSIIFEYQYLWLYAALMNVQNISSRSVNFALQQFYNANNSPALRAVNAIFIAKYGTPTQQRMVKDQYQQEQSEYVRAGILYASRYFASDQERSTAYGAWGGHSELNSLIVAAIRRAPLN